MGFLGAIWSRAKETPYERRDRQRKEAAGAKKKPGPRKKAQLKAAAEAATEHYEVTLHNGRKIEW
jgi:hypothetical protein